MKLFTKTVIEEQSEHKTFYVIPNNTIAPLKEKGLQNLNLVSK